ncbi:hypothetical protein D3C77_615100 [compost metagenome]
MPLVPLARVRLGGVIWIWLTVALVTVSTVPALVTPFRLALIVLVPTATPVARPWVLMVTLV